MVRFGPQSGKKIIASACVLSCGCAWIVDVPEPLRDRDGGGETPSSGGAGGSGGTSSMIDGATSAGSGGMAAGGSNSGGAGASIGGNGGQSSVDAGTGGLGNCVAICDCDGDTYLAEGACNGTDCDDNDPDAHPDQTAYFPNRSDVVGFDYNCDNMPERDPLLDVPAPDCLLPAVSCPATAGYVSVPMCGESGQWATCKVDGLSCIPSPVDSLVMKCH